MTGMRDVRVGKIVVNIGVGESGEKLSKAQKVLQMVTGQKPVQTLAHGAVRDWAVRQNMPIGAKVTLRGEKAVAFLRRALAVRNNRLPDYVFDRFGNFSFGIADYTDFEGMKYDPEIGVFGMDVNVCLVRPGFRVAERRVAPGRVPHRHRVTKEEAVTFVQQTFSAEVAE
ncbi:MAG: 50S ribosomal protein L5 [Methanobacteriota archaeon]|nr:MAG: 50S ribosomal protein L5 [Euryarchaeota archaeon]